MQLLFLLLLLLGYTTPGDLSLKIYFGGVAPHGA
jgi:hypothetical protein